MTVRARSRSMLTGLGQIGVRSDDTAAERQLKASFTLVVVAIVVLACVWVTIYWLYGLTVPALVPATYQVCSIAALAWFAATGRFAAFRTFELGLMLLLPVALQLSLGGFVNASGVMLWAFMAPLGALLFGARAVPWFIAFVLLAVGAGAADGIVASRAPSLPPTVRVPFFVLNIGAVSGTAFQLLRHVMRQRDRARAEAEFERERSERILRNILPESVAQRLKDGEEVIADAADEVTVLFTDIVGFTSLAAELPPDEVVAILDRVFTRLDELADAHGVERIKTIGDAYLAVAGLPEAQVDHAERIADLALAMCAEFEVPGAFGVQQLAIRVGIDAGPVVAGVIGRRRFAYDLWGDTVNTASRMESHGVTGRIHVTERVRDRLAGRFRFEPRGTIEVKGKGRMRTWFLVGRLPSSAAHGVPAGQARMSPGER